VGQHPWHDAYTSLRTLSSDLRPFTSTSPSVRGRPKRLRNRHYKRVEIEETRDDDADGVPDVYERRDPAIGS
jgi:NhaA family Na+:H+ antiporter